jgi:hypothetical protein
VNVAVDYNLIAVVSNVKTKLFTDATKVIKHLPGL